MPIPPIDQVTSFDQSNIPVLQKVLDDIRMKSPMIRYVSTEPTANDVQWHEYCIYDNGVDKRRLYMKTGKNQLMYVEFATGPGSTATSIGTKIMDTDKDTKVDTEESSDEDIVRIDNAGSETATFNTSGLAMTSGLKVILDGYGGDTYSFYDSSTQYMTFYVDGVKRLEM